MITLPSDMDTEFTVGSDIRTVPNLVTFLRLLCVPLFLWLLFGAERQFSAAVLLAVLGATDWVDGWLARILDQHSAFGKAFDPVVDRIMFVVAIVAMLIDRSVPLWFGIAVLAREVVVSAMALLLEARGAERIEVSWWGKASTFGLMFALPMYLAAASGVGDPDVWWAVATAIGVPSLIAHVWSGVGYVPAVVESLRAPSQTR